jgi:siroheme synthase-like protein
MSVSSADVVLAITALVAAIVNGAIGYGFSSITVPIALLFFPNRALNPALVLIELGINALLLIANRRALPRALPAVKPLLLGVLPGVAIGTLLLASTSSGPLKLATYAILLPLLLAQTAGWRRPIGRAPAAHAVLGGGIGILYAATTVSGPPLALLLNNQGLVKEEFRAALSLFRLVESGATAALYLGAGLFTAQSVRLSGFIAPSIALGLPLGHLLIRKVQPDAFRRLCMGSDVVLVGFGLARTAVDLQILPAVWAFGGFALLCGMQLQSAVRYLERRASLWGATARGESAGALDYPVALRLAGRRVLLVGGGRVAEGRLRGLLAAGARPRVVSVSATPLFDEEAARGRIELERRAYRTGDCRGAQLVLSAVDDAEVSRRVASEARQLGVLVNCADKPELCDFHLPSVGRRGPLTIAVSTAGLAPTLARHTRDRALELIGPEYGVLARLIGRLRRRVSGGPSRAGLFAELVSSDVLSHLSQGRRATARRRVREILSVGRAPREST